MNYWVITARIEIYTRQLIGELDPAFALTYDRFMQLPAPMVSLQ
jgi:hypothetical protein